MNSFLIYMAKTAVYLAGFYLVYIIFLSMDTMHQRNRIYILLSMMISFLLPLITVNIREHGSISYFGKVLSSFMVTYDGSKGSAQIGSVSHLSFYTIIYNSYITGLIIFGLKLTCDVLSLLLLILRQKDKREGIIYFKGFNTAGFSAMGYIFINNSLNPDEAKEIIRHEKCHLDQNHFFDILFVEFVKIIQWFNPVIHLYNRSLRTVHEYQADNRCLNSDMTLLKYQNLLLNHLFRSKIFKPSNSFSTSSLIKKRMIMMTKKRTPTLANCKILLVLPVIIFLLAFISSCRISSKLSSTKSEIAPPPPPPSATAQEVPPEVFVVVEEMPEFPGGEKALLEFINSNIQYPEIAYKNNIQGRVILRFAVMANGYVDKVQVLKSVDPALDQEAIRVIKILPVWTPGKQGGKPVNVWYNVPVIFQYKQK